MLQYLPPLRLNLTHPAVFLYKACWTPGMHKGLEQQPLNSKYLGDWQEGRSVREEKSKPEGTHRA